MIVVGSIWLILVDFAWDSGRSLGLNPKTKKQELHKILEVGSDVSTEWVGDHMKWATHDRTNQVAVADVALNMRI